MQYLELIQILKVLAIPFIGVLVWFIYELFQDDEDDKE